MEKFGDLMAEVHRGKECDGKSVEYVVDGRFTSLGKAKVIALLRGGELPSADGLKTLFSDLGNPNRYQGIWWTAGSENGHQAVLVVDGKRMECRTTWELFKDTGIPLNGSMPIQLRFAYVRPNSKLMRAHRLTLIKESILRMGRTVLKYVENE